MPFTPDAIASQLVLALIVGNVLVDQLGIPVPAVPTLVVAGAVATAHPAWGVELFILSVLACTAADTVWYLAGRRYGNGVMKLLCRISVTPDSCVNETYVRFERWGPKAIVVAKFVPGLAIIAPPLAGALKMGWTRFLALTAAAGALWAGVYLAAGALFRSQIDWLLPRIAGLGGPAGLLALLVLAAYVGYKWWQRRKFLSMLRMARISVDELYERLKVPPAPVIVDVRSASARSLDPRWIPGALHVPLADVDRHVKDLPRDGEVILYCTCPNEATAARVAKLLMARGFTRVRPLHGGLDAWVAAGYAVETVATPPA